MNLELYDRLYDSFKRFVLEQSKYNVSVKKKPYGDDYPKVVLQEISTKGISNKQFTDTYSQYGYEINIYAKNIGSKDSMEIARELSGVVSSFMEGKLHMKLVVCKPSPNIDDTVYRITMRYITSANDYRGHFIM